MNPRENNLMHSDDVVTPKQAANFIFDIINKSFIFENRHIRTFIIVEEIWFCGKDVSSILGYENNRKAIIDHVEFDDKIPLNDLLKGCNSCSIYYTKLYIYNKFIF